MAVKTKDINFNNFNFDNGDVIANGKGYTAIYISDVIKNKVSTDISMSIEGDYLKITKGDNTLKLTNYLGIKYIKTDYHKNGRKETYNLTDIISELPLVDNTANTINTYNPKNLTVTGTTNYNDKIDVSKIKDLEKTPFDKGLTIDGRNGNDIITGSMYSDTIKGGNGNDEITGGTGNDTITGGAGVNVINYSIGEDNDTINLTKGEKFTLNLTDLTENDLMFKIEKKALIISYDKVIGEEHVTGSIKLNNFGAKDVTNNSTKNTADTSSVEMILSDSATPIDLRTYLYKLNVTSNYTGGWLNEDINASNVEQKHDKKGNPLQTGVTLNGGNGNDVITGSNYNDTISGGNGIDTILGGSGDDKINAGDGDDIITGGTGNDTISGGKGNDTFIFNLGDGADTITDAAKGDILQLNNVSSTEIANKIFFLKAGNNLQIRYNLPENNDSITINNYFDKKGNINKNTLDEIHTSDYSPESDNKISLSNLLKNYTYPITGQGKINGTNGDDTIYGSIANDTITAGKGDDTIFANKGNDAITGGEGANTIIYNKSDFGTDTINLTKNENLTIDLTAYPYTDANALKDKIKINGKNLEITIPKDDGSNYGKLILSKFANTNVVGNNGSVNILLKKESEPNAGDEIIINLNEAELFEYTVTDNNYNSKTKLYKFNGSRFSETITADGLTHGTSISTGAGINTVNLSNATGNNTITGGADKDIVNLNDSATTNVKVGDGENEINISGTGNNTIISGKHNDVININENTATTTIQAGAGVNTININNSTSFGKITLVEEKNNATNIINFSNNFGTNYEFIKNGNTLTIKNGDSQIQINDFYAESTSKIKYATKVIKINGVEIDVDSKLTAMGKTMSIAGSGPIDGTDNGETIYGSTGKDTINAKAGNDIIYANGGDDIIHAELGNNTVYGGEGNDKIYGGENIYGEEGNDEIHVSGSGWTTIYIDEICGNDTIIFTGNTLTHLEFTDIADLDSLRDRITLEQRDTDYILHYGNNDITIKGLNDKSYVDLKPNTGEEVISLENYPMTSIITEAQRTSYGQIDGTNDDDIIYGSNKADQIYGQKGNDKIYAKDGNDYINGGNGDDTIDAGTGSNRIIFNEGYGNDTILNGGGTDTLEFNAEIKFISRKEDDLIVSFGTKGEVVTIKDYYVKNHNVKISSYQTFGDYNVRTVDDALKAINGSGGLTDTDKYNIKIRGTNAEVIFDEGKGISVPNNGRNYIYAKDEGLNINASSSNGSNYFIGGSGNDTLTGGKGDDYFAGGNGHNVIKAGGGQDRIAVASAGEDNVIVFDNITFQTDNEGKVTGLRDLKITDMQGDNRTDNVYIKYGTDSIIAENYFYKGDVPYYYEGYTLQDKDDNTIKLADAVKMSINREGETDWTVGDLHGNSTDETFYTNSTDEALKYASRVDVYNGSVDAGAGNDTIYSGGIYQSETDGTTKPYIWGGDGNDTIHAEGNKIYFTTSREDLIYSDTNLIAINTKQTNGNTTTTTVYDADHIYITPDKKVMTGYFFFAYQLGKDNSDNTTVESIMLDKSDKYEYVGTYHYEDAGMDVHVYHTDDLANCKIEGKKTYFFDYGDKVASGQITAYGGEGDDTIYIGNGSSAYGGDGNDIIEGDGIAYGEDGNDKIIFNNDNHYFDGLGFTYYYADGGKGNDYVDMRNVIKREHETLELTSQSVEYENEYDTQFMFSEGINTLVINPDDDKNIIINMSQFAWNEQNRHDRWYDYGHKNSDVAFGTFKRGNDLYIAMTNGEAKNGTLIIKDYYTFSPQRQNNLKIYFYSTIRDNGNYFLPESYMTVDEFIQHYDEWNRAIDTNNDGHKDYDPENNEAWDAFYNHRISEINGKGYAGRQTAETNNYFTFIDNQEVNKDTINPQKETPEFYEHGTEAVVENPNQPTIVTYNTINVYHNAGYYIIGGDGAQTINGGDGDDVIYGDNIGHHDENGNWVEAQTGGDDKIYAGAGDDFVVGGKGDDFIDGGDGQNVLYGGEGNDTIIAGSPVNTTISQYGDISRGNGSTYAYGEEGNDKIYSQAILNPDGTINEEASNAYLAEGTGEGTQYLYGGGGDDTIIANSYRQKVYAGAGDDTVKFYNNNGSEMEISKFDYNENQIYLGEGNDKFYAYGNGGYAVSADSGNNLIDASGSSAVAYIQGGTGNDTIYGGSGKEYINTGLGSSTVYAGDGDDVIYSGTGEYYSATDMHKSDEIHGGEGNDTIELYGNSKAFGDGGNDIISLDGGRQNVPSALTIDGGTGNDIYRGTATNGVNTIIASEGNDIIQFFNLSPKCFKAYKKGNDFIIEKTDSTGNNSGLTVLKDYYKESEQAKFNNWTVETYSDNQRGPQRGKFTMSEFINYISGNVQIITSGIGTNDNNYIEAVDSVTNIDGKAGNDNIIAGSGAEIIKGGAGDDYILGSHSYNEQIILGDSGNATIEMVDNNGYTAYKTTYTSADNSGDGNDNIISYADRSFIFGEGGDDTITVNGEYAHVWGGSGDDVISTAAYDEITNSYANEIFGEGGNDTIKARAGFIDGGDGDDTIIQKACGINNSSTSIQILKAKFGATQEWIDKLVNDNESINIKSQRVANEYKKIETTQNNIRDYEYAIKTCEANGWEYYGNTSVNEYRRKLTNAKASYNGLKSTYEELEQSVTAVYQADIAANNTTSLDGQKGSKDLYIDAMLSENSTEKDKADAKAVYEHDKALVQTYKEFVEKYDDLTYNGWLDGNYYNFRDEGDKAYWQNKLEESELALDGVTGTKTAYDNLHATSTYTNYHMMQTKLDNYQAYLTALKNNEAYSGPTFTDYSQDSWFNKADLLKDSIQGCEGTKNTYEKINTYVNNYDEVSGHDLAYLQDKLTTATEHKNNYYDYDMTYDEACAEYDNAKFLVDNYEDIISKAKANWQELLPQAEAAYKNDQYLYDLYSTYAEFYYDEEFNDPNYAQHTLDIKNDGETPVYISFREEAEQNYSPYYDGSPKNYWSRMASLIYSRMNGATGTQAIADEMYMRYQAGQIPYSTYKSWYEENERNIDEYNEYRDFYNNFDNPNVSADILREYDAYIGHYTKENLEGYIPDLRASINGSGATYKSLKADLDETIADYIENAPGLTKHDKEIALKIMTHNQNDIILGGEGDDTITIGHTDEGDYQSIGTTLAMGEEGDDTYIIEGGYTDNYGNFNNPKLLIYDKEGTNTIKFNREEYNSGNIGMYANVELVKDSEGNFEKDEYGNYKYVLKNFGPSYAQSIGDSGLASSYGDTPLYNGDSGYAIVFVDNGSYKDTLNTFNSGGLANRSQEGVKFDADTFNTLDYIWSNDGKYITKTQIQAAMQNTANWLAQNNYDSFMNALDYGADHSNKAQILTDLRNFENLGSLEWITPTGENETPTANDIIAPATEGLTGTDSNDTLVIDSKPVPTKDNQGNVTDINNVIDLKQGNDKVTFEGEFGDYIIKSSSTVDNVGIARQYDTISLAGYSVQDGTLKFSQVGKDLVITAYSDATDDESAVGSVTYEGFLGSDYSLRSFVLKADDREYMVSKETSSLKVVNESSYNKKIEDDENSYYNIRFIESTDGSKVELSTNGKRAYYYLLGNTPINLGWVKDGEPVEIFSQGETNDSYKQGLTADINLTIHDAGGNNELIIANASYNGSGAVTDDKFRLFFDIDTEGNVSQTKHIIWQERFRPYETVNVKHGEGNNAYYTTDEVYYYDTDNLLKLLNNDPEHMEGAISFDGDLYRIQTDNRTDHSSWIVNAEDVDASVLPDKYIRSISTDVIPWLKDNKYESVSDALTKLKLDIAAKQELMEVVEVESEDFTTYKNAITADNAKINELMDFFNIGYGSALYNNLYGTDGDDTLNGSYSYTTSRIIGGKGNDTIDLYNANEASIIYNFDPVNGDGHDVVIENLYTQSHNQIIVDRGENTMFTKFRTDGWDLKIEFYSNSESTENPDGSITLQNYFKDKYDYRTDVLIVKSGSEVEHNYSIKELLIPENLINDNVFFSTPASDNFEQTGKDRVIYIANSDYNTNDTIENSSKNDEIYISQNNSYTDISYTVGQGGDDVIYGSFYATGLIVDYADTHAQTEYRQIGDDMKMIFFMGDGAEKHKVGSITFKDYYVYNSSKIGDSNSEDYDRFIFRTGTGVNTIDTKVNSVTLLEEYRLLGGSLEDNNDAPYFSETVTDASQNTVISTETTQNTLVFNDVESFRDLSFAISDNNLIITHNGKTTTILGYKAGNSSITHLRVGDLVKDLNDNRTIPNRDLAIPESEKQYNTITVENDATEIYGTYNSDYIEIPASAVNVTKVYTKENGGNDGGNDVVKGTINNAEIKTFDRGDTVEISGHGNTIQGGIGNDVYRITTDEGTNTLVFDYSDGNDIIENTSGNVLINMVHGYALTIEKFGDDLRIKYWDNNNALYIKEYFKENGCNKNAIFSIKIQNNEAVSLETYINNYLENKGLGEIPDTTMTTITGSDYNDLIKIPENVANAITQIKANSGDDRIIGTIENAVINGGWGDDTIDISGSGNTIRGNRGNDVINITAGNGQTNTVYFADGDGNSNSSYCGNDIINAIGGNLKLQFCDQWLTDLTLARKEDYLIVRYNNDNNAIFIKDYFNNNVNTANIIIVSDKNSAEMSLDDFITQNYSSTTGLYEVWGTDGDDKFIHQITDEQSVTYNLGKGNDTLEFVSIPGNNKDNITRQAVVNSVSENDTDHNVLNKDTINMQSYSGNYNKFRFGFGENGAITVSSIYDKGYDGHKRIESDVTYNNFLNKDANGNWMTPDLEIMKYADDEYPYQIKRYDSVQTIDTYKSYNNDVTNTYENVGAIYIKAGSGTSNINDGNSSETDWILTDGGANLNYTGGGDMIITNSSKSNDTYSINGFSSATYIKDNGGSDTLNLTDLSYGANNDLTNPSYNDLLQTYLVFNVDKYGNGDDTFVLSKNTQSIPAWYAGQYLGGKKDTADYSITIDAARNNGKNIGIEKVTAKTNVIERYDEDNYPVYKEEKIADINMESWYNAIKTDVVNWLNDNHYDSTAEVFGLDTDGSNANYQLVKDLCAIYEQYTANDFKM